MKTKHKKFFKQHPKLSICLIALFLIVAIGFYA